MISFKLLQFCIHIRLPSISYQLLQKFLKLPSRFSGTTLDQEMKWLKWGFRTGTWSYDAVSLKHT